MVLEQKHLLTYEDYAALPDDGKRYELIDGVLYVTPSPTFWHQKIADRICAEILFYLRDHPLGEAISAPLDVILDPESKIQTFQPDVMFISNERRSIITDKNIQGAPDLVVEVLSEGSQNRDLGPKKRNYMRYGVREYWIVWQDLPRVEVYRLQESGHFGKPALLEEGDTLITDLLPGFSLEVSRLYADVEAAIGRGSAGSGKT